MEKKTKLILMKDEEYFLIQLLKGGIVITDSISQRTIFESILSKLK